MNGSVVYLFDYLPIDEAVVLRDEPATVIVLPVIRVEQKHKPAPRPASPLPCDVEP
jgi:hypothetical protein